ncbi:MAG: iron-sulfur cluster assembly scaffold protein [Proteobacteria bacterium]|nr:iron-sulfur cluster assembly scaffold protein [Pseudomonadota bacterium]
MWENVVIMEVFTSDSELGSVKREISMIKEPDGYGEKISECGDTIKLFLTIQQGVVKDVSYEVNGCTFTLACAHAVAQLARGKAVNEVARSTSPERIDELTGGLPEANKHCAEFASEAMAEALKDAVIGQRDSWRKLYRKR